ncbi:helix-turn-helix domain-containing protein [Halobium salinum]|uniref:Helix-turn-helix domain-containing protein n=1 Tax=Halobium salinum TaxID=1364940 RepID=A0ABD5P9R7_9EURY|nr:helix-turn-helix domain-containing protein [Halobium salinum]
MTTIVEFSVDPAALVLPSFGSRPQAEAEIVSLAACDGPLSQLLRCRGPTGPEETVAALDADPTVAEAGSVSDLGDGWLCRVEWDEVGPLVPYLTERMDAAVELAALSGGRWTLRVWFPADDDVSDLLRFETDTGVDAGLEVERVHTTAEGERTPFGLSEAQYDAVRHALQSGYYDIPRRATTGDLAAAFDISQQALSERLRRAHGRLADGAVADAAAGEEGPADER